MFKKLLLVAALAATVSAAAAPRLQRISSAAARVNPMFEKGAVIAPENIGSQAASRSESLVFNFCEEQYSAYSLSGLTEGIGFYQLTELSEYFTKLYAGAEITAINIATPTNTNYVNTLTDSVKVVIYTDLNAEPVYSQMAKLGPKGFEYSKVTLKDPFVVTGDTPVYFGYELTYHSSYATESKQCLFLVVDSGEAFMNSNYIGMGAVGQEPVFYTMVQAGMPFNLCITADATFDGEVLNLANCMTLFPDPTVVAGNEFAVEINVKNFGSEAINSVGLAYSINGVESTQTCRFDEPVGAFGNGYTTAVFKTDDSGFDIPIEAKVIEVNGQPNEYAYSEEATELLTVIENGKAAKRNIVIEEATGTWCGWCPMGYVLLESIRTKYDNLFVIGVHDGDAMAAASYADFIKNYISGYPQYLISRCASPGLYANAAYNEQTYDYYHATISAWPAIATIDFDAVANPENSTIQVDTKTTFGLSGNANYRLAVVVKEDSVGPYRQTNNLYGQAGWGEFTKTSRPSVIFNDVAREIKTWKGIAGSIPSEIEADVTYDYSVSISSAKVAGNECDVVVMLINDANGMIEQAACKHVVVKESGIDEVRGSDSGAAAYFDLNGRKLQAPVRGVNIERTANGTVRKIFVK